MAEVSLTNQVDISGQYGESSTPISFASNIVTTTIVQGLTVNKVADKVNWINGPLTYTVTIENNSGATLSSGVLTDNLNTSLVEFNTTYGVQIDGTPTASSNYTYNDGELKVTLPELTDSNTTTVTFQVTRK